MNLGERILSRRNKLGLSQDEFAKIVGVSRQTISKWELGESYPDLSRLENICVALSVTPSYLFDDLDDLTDSSACGILDNNCSIVISFSSIGEKIKKFRQSNGMSQDMLGEMLDVSRQTVSKWENSTMIPETEKFIKMPGIFKESTKSFIDYQILRYDTPDENEAEQEASTVESFAEKRNLIIAGCSILAIMIILIIFPILAIFNKSNPTSIINPHDGFDITVNTENNEIKLKLSNAVNKISLADCMDISADAVCRSLNDGGSYSIYDEIEIPEGENHFTLKLNDKTTYYLEIYRNRIFTVRFEGIEKNFLYEEGSYIDIPKNYPEYRYYNVEGWDFDFGKTTVSQDMEIPIILTPKKYTVTYYCNGGNIGGEMLVKQKIPYGTDISEVPERQGYTFGGWFEDGSLTIENGTIYGEVSLYARWLEESPSAIFDYIIEADGGVTVSIVNLPDDVRLRNEILKKKIVIPEYIENCKVTGIGEIRYGSDIVLPKSIIRFLDDSFINNKGCKIYWKGTAAEWEQIYHGSEITPIYLNE